MRYAFLRRPADPGSSPLARVAPRPTSPPRSRDGRVPGRLGGHLLPGRPAPHVHRLRELARPADRLLERHVLGRHHGDLRRRDVPVARAVGGVRPLPGRGKRHLAAVAPGRAHLRLRRAAGRPLRSRRASGATRSCSARTRSRTARATRRCTSSRSSQTVGGARLFDHNRVSDPLGSYALTPHEQLDDLGRCRGVPRPRTDEQAHGHLRDGLAELDHGHASRAEESSTSRTTSTGCRRRSAARPTASTPSRRCGFVQFQPGGEILSELASGPFDSTTNTVRQPPARVRRPGGDDVGGALVRDVERLHRCAPVGQRLRAATTSSRRPERAGSASPSDQHVPPRDPRAVATNTITPGQNVGGR